MNARSASVRCVGCEMPLDRPGAVYAGLTYCCEGCAGGGPCVCTYDERVPSNADSVDHLGLPFAAPSRAADPAVRTPVAVSTAKERTSELGVLLARR